MLQTSPRRPTFEPITSVEACGQIGEISLPRGYFSFFLWDPNFAHIPRINGRTDFNGV